MRYVAVGGFCILAGALGGFAAHWPGALLSMRLNGAGYTGVSPHWDPGFATFSALYHGVPFGVIFGGLGYLAGLSRLSVERLLLAVPILFAAALAGALLVSPFGIIPQLPASAVAYLATCGWVLRRERVRLAAA